MSEDSANEHTMDAMRAFVLTTDAQTGETVAPANDPQDGSVVFADRAIDFAALQQINPEIVAWLYIPGTNIDYPVTHTDNDDYYLKHGPDLQENRAGSIFLEAACTPTLTDKNTIIYGHRMNNGSMFGSLNQFEDKEYFMEHQTGFLYTPDGVRFEFTFYALVHSSDSMASPAYRLDFTDDADFLDTVQEVKDVAIVTADNVTVEAGDKIITLSTCLKGDGTKRLVMQGKVVG